MADGWWPGTKTCLGVSKCLVLSTCLVPFCPKFEWLTQHWVATPVDIVGRLKNWPLVLLCFDTLPSVVKIRVFPKIWENPQIMNLNRVFHYKPSILGYPYFWKHPYQNSTKSMSNAQSPAISELSRPNSLLMCLWVHFVVVSRWMFPQIRVFYPPKWMVYNIYNGKNLL